MTNLLCHEALEEVLPQLMVPATAEDDDGKCRSIRLHAKEHPLRETVDAAAIRIKKRKLDAFTTSSSSHSSSTPAVIDVDVDDTTSTAVDVATTAPTPPAWHVQDQQLLGRAYEVPDDSLQILDGRPTPVVDPLD